MPFHPSSLRLRFAVDALHRGGVVACPTEAVWGLSCNPDDSAAVERLLALKQRSPSRGLILVAANESQLGFLLAGLSATERRVLSETWPGPTTWLLPHRDRVPPWIHGDHETVAVRVSDHPVVRALCLGWGGPLVSSSANPSGSRPPVAGFQVRRFFGDELDCILPGHVGRRKRPTAIRELASGRTVRA